MCYLKFFYLWIWCCKSWYINLSLYFKSLSSNIDIEYDNSFLKYWNFLSPSWTLFNMYDEICFNFYNLVPSLFTCSSYLRNDITFRNLCFTVLSNFVLTESMGFRNSIALLLYLIVILLFTHIIFLYYILSFLFLYFFLSCYCFWHIKKKFWTSRDSFLSISNLFSYIC